jgi:hypothetical protein
MGVIGPGFIRSMNLEMKTQALIYTLSLVLPVLFRLIRMTTINGITS